MKHLLTILTAITLTSCGADVANQVAGETDEAKTSYIESEPCSTSEVEGGAIITCPDGTESFVEDGSDGANGLSGTDGSNGIDGLNGTNGSDGLAGSDGAAGSNGSDGSNGATGTAGTNGSDSLSRKVYDSAGVYWGTSHTETNYINLTNGAIMRFSTSSPYDFASAGLRFYASADCTGAFSLGFTNPSVSNLHYNTSDGKWFVPKGDTIAFNANFASKLDNLGNCQVGSISPTVSYDSLEVDMSSYTARFTFAGPTVRIINGPMFTTDN